jgi:RNA recognition motif-containing protein
LCDVKGLPFGDALTEDYVRNLFADHGQIDSVKIALDMNTNMPRGQAFVRFVDQKSAENALTGKERYSNILLI